MLDQQMKQAEHVRNLPGIPSTDQCREEGRAPEHLIGMVTVNAHKVEIENITTWCLTFIITCLCPRMCMHEPLVRPGSIAARRLGEGRRNSRAP